jgi:hypothetical protein
LPHKNSASYITREPSNNKLYGLFNCCIGTSRFASDAGEMKSAKLGSTILRMSTPGAKSGSSEFKLNANDMYTYVYSKHTARPILLSLSTQNGYLLRWSGNGADSTAFIISRWQNEMAIRDQFYAHGTACTRPRSAVWLDTRRTKLFLLKSVFSLAK